MKLYNGKWYVKNIKTVLNSKQSAKQVTIGPPVSNRARNINLVGQIYYNRYKYTSR